MSSRPIYLVLKYLLCKDSEEQLFQQLLLIVQIMTNITGSLDKKQQQEQFIKAICLYCLPSADYEMSPKHIQTNKMILNIAHCLGSNLSIFNF
jgi:hypothetical protein